jgi:hypothetical protein
MMAGMDRDWNYTWEHWRELSDEERDAVRREILAGTVAAGEAFVLAAKRAAEAMREFARAMEKPPR